jgi:hypothetical protein
VPSKSDLRCACIDYASGRPYERSEAASSVNCTFQEGGWYCRALPWAALALVLATPWHAYLCFPSEDLPAAVLVFVLGMSPYGALAAVARWIRYPAMAILGGLVLLVTDASAGYSVLRSTSSTAGVALVIQPLLGLLVVVPITIVFALFVRRGLDGD